LPLLVLKRGKVWCIKMTRATLFWLLLYWALRILLGLRPATATLQNFVNKPWSLFNLGDLRFFLTADGHNCAANFNLDVPVRAWLKYFWVDDQRLIHKNEGAKLWPIVLKVKFSIFELNRRVVSWDRDIWNSHPSVKGSTNSGWIHFWVRHYVYSADLFLLINSLKHNIGFIFLNLWHFIVI
jgi:hypothetical protein